MDGAFWRAWRNRSRTRAAPTPTNSSTKSEPQRLKNGASASPAMALASSVLPVPGAPTSSTPRGMRPPMRWNFSGLRRNWMISSHLLLGLLDAGHVIEGDRRPLLAGVLRAAADERHQPSRALAARIWRFRK